MTYLDTNVIVAWVIEGHPHHDLSYLAIADLPAEEPLAVALHGLAELFATLTKPTGAFDLGSGQARMVVNNVRRACTVVAATEQIYARAIGLCDDLMIGGPVVYDALHLASAEACGADRLLTLNDRGFVRFRGSTSVDLRLLRVR